jgi:putative phosphoesterase
MHTFSDLKRMVVLSDTHGLIRTGVEPELAGAELILHAGDVGSSGVLAWLGRFAPAIAVRGNIDDDRLGLPETEVVSVNGELIYLLHQLERLDLNPHTAGLRLVVSGHSHKASITQSNEVCFCNPGSIGPRRFRLPITLVSFTLGTEAWTGTLRELIVPPASGIERFETRANFTVKLPRSSEAGPQINDR